MYKSFYLFCIGLIVFSTAQGMGVRYKPPLVIGVKTSDNTQYMLLNKYVSQSRVLKEGIKDCGSKGLITSIDMPFESFKVLVPYLKIGAEITRLQQEVAKLSPQQRERQKQNIKFACDQLAKKIAGYSQREWRACMRAATQLKIDMVLPIALLVGKNGDGLNTSLQSKDVQ